MAAGCSGKRARTTWVVLLVLPALAFRLLIPTGFMPSASDGFPFTMQMCHGDGRSAEVIRVLGQEPQPADRDTVHDAPCVFAATGTAAPLPAPVIVLAHQAPVALDDAPRLAVAPLLAPRRTHTPRAPPSQV